MDIYNFKVFFEKYFDYPFDKLDFSFSDNLKSYMKPLTSLNDAYKVNQVSFFIFGRIKWSSSMYWGFFKVPNFDFYIPMYLVFSKAYNSPIITFDFNENVYKSIFDDSDKHIYLKKEKRRYFYNKIIRHLPDKYIENVVKNSVFYEKYKNKYNYKFSFYLDFERHSTEFKGGIVGKSGYNETISIENSYFDDNKLKFGFSFNTFYEKPLNINFEFNAVSATDMPLHISDIYNGAFSVDIIDSTDVSKITSFQDFIFKYKELKNIVDIYKY